MDIFLDEEDFRFYLNRLKVCQKEFGFELYAVCLMTNHYHLIIRDACLDLPLIMDAINSVYVRYFNEKYNRKGPLFSGPFKHSIIFTELQMIRLIRYINRNPVAAGMTYSIYDYEWAMIVPKRDYLGLINFDYIDEVFNKVCRTSYEEYMKSCEDDLWADEIELHVMDDETAESVFLQIYKKTVPAENINDNKIDQKYLREVLMWARHRKITIRQISKFTGLSSYNIRKIIKDD